MKTKISVILLFVCVTLFSQNFPGNHPELLIGKIVKPIEDEKNKRYLYRNFYSKYDIDNKKLDKYSDKTRLFPKSSSQSNYDELVGVEFEVIQIFDIDKKSAVLEIFSNEVGTVYYDYDKVFDFKFELEVVDGLEIPDSYYCELIEKKDDKFSNTITYSTPFNEGIKFIKTVEDGKSKTFIMVNESGATLNVGQKGLILLLENDKRIDRPEAKIDVKVSSSSNYLYTAFVELTDSELELLENNNITDDRLYIYEGEISSGLIIRKQLNCLTTL